MNTLLAEPKKELSIKEIQRIMGWSYPHALAFAQRYGRRDESNGLKRWLVPFEMVESRVNEQVIRVNRSVALLHSIGSR